MYVFNMYICMYVRCMYCMFVCMYVSMMYVLYVCMYVCSRNANVIYSTQWSRIYNCVLILNSGPEWPNSGRDPVCC